jgi:hypothetical protein
MGAYATVSRRGILHGVNVPGPYPFHGHVVWLTEEQGGRRTGTPRSPYTATALVPPETLRGGLASFVLRDFDSTKLVPEASARWLAVDNLSPHLIEPGSVVLITEGPRTVGYFLVATVDRAQTNADEPD